jgi:NAD+ diphosphatase
VQIIEPTQLGTTYSDYEPLFFTDDGIISPNQTLTTTPFKQTVEQLNLSVKRLYLHASTLIVKCQSTLTLDEISRNGFHIYNPKAFLASAGDDIQRLILRALQWLTWDEKVQCCSKCGRKIQRIADSPEKKCGVCDLSFFPKFSPAIMVLIQREDEVLLARSAHFKPGFYSALAGFIDMGETAEQAVHREVKEEVGLEVSDLEYFGTQAWPFPDSFMIAFKATYLRGEINIDTNEIEDARWFNLNNLPDLPSSSSISRQLIDSFRSDPLLSNPSINPPKS